MTGYPTPNHLLNDLKQNRDRPWLICGESQNSVKKNRDRFYLLLEEFLARLTQLVKEKEAPQVLIVESDPIRFLASFLAVLAAKCDVFLGNPHWQAQEWQQVFEAIAPDLIFGDLKSSFSLPIKKECINKAKEREAKIMIPTGGTSGKIRFAIHTWETLCTSVRGFCQYFELASVNSFCVLPLYHVSGLMQFLRSYLTQGTLVILPYKTLKEEKEIELNINSFFISLVPTQLQFLLQTKPDWLRQFDAVLLGGAPAWRSLLNEARKARIKLAPTYGMTETASQIVTLKPEEFLKGNDSNGRVLPHAQIEFDLASIITIKSDSLFLGYYPDLLRSTAFITDDIGYLDRQGYLYILGRNSQKIITGGENVFPSEIEAAILATELVRDVAVVGLPDPQWGQIVTAIYVPQQLKSQPEEIIAMISSKLKNTISRFKHPKYWLAIENLPRNAQGKINYKSLQKLGLEKYQQENKIDISSESKSKND
jgi:O-succinylbenzoic acid--CoA ligase